MRYDRDALIALGHAIVLQAARDYAQGLIQRRFVRWHDPETLRAWLTEYAEYYGEVNADRLIRRCEEGAAEFRKVSDRLRAEGGKAECPICRGIVTRRRTSHGTTFVRCSTCGVSKRYGR